MNKCKLYFFKKTEKSSALQVSLVEYLHSANRKLFDLIVLTIPGIAEENFGNNHISCCDVTEDPGKRSGRE